MKDPLEKRPLLLNKHSLAYRVAKFGKNLVSILIPTDVHDLIKLLMDKGIWKACQIKETNPFVFANHRKMEDHCSGLEVLHSVALKANVQRIEDFNATKNRHRISDLYAALDLSPSERKLCLSHMGHSDQVSSSIYQMPHSTGQ